MCSNPFCLGEVWCIEWDCCDIDRKRKTAGRNEEEPQSLPQKKRTKGETTMTKRFGFPKSSKAMNDICKGFVPRNTRKSTSEVRSYKLCAFDVCPVTSLIIFSGTLALNIAVVPVARRLRFIFLLLMPVHHTCSSKTFSVFLSPLGQPHTNKQMGLRECWKLASNRIHPTPYLTVADRCHSTFHFPLSTFQFPVSNFHIPFPVSIFSFQFPVSNFRLRCPQRACARARIYVYDHIKRLAPPRLLEKARLGCERQP